MVYFILLASPKRKRTHKQIDKISTEEKVDNGRGSATAAGYHLSPCHLSSFSSREAAPDSKNESFGQECCFPVSKLRLSETNGFTYFQLLLLTHHKIR